MKTGVAGRRLASILDETKLRRVLEKMLDENEFLSEFGIRSLSRFHEKHPFVMNVGGQEYRVELPAGRVRHRHVRRQLELARADLDAGQRPHHPGAVAVLQLLRRRLHRGMPDRLRPADEPVPGGRGDRPAAGEHLPPGQGRPPAGLRRHARSSRTTRTGATSSSSTSTSTATTGPGSGPATRPAGPASSPGSCTCSRRRPPSRCSNSARRPGSSRCDKPRIAVPAGVTGSESEPKGQRTPMNQRTAGCRPDLAAVRGRVRLHGAGAWKAVTGSAGGGTHAPRRRRRLRSARWWGPILALFAFMLAFTFGMAGSRFEARRQAVLEEANAIGTTYLRTRLLPRAADGARVRDCCGSTSMSGCAVSRKARWRDASPARRNSRSSSGRKPSRRRRTTGARLPASTSSR